MRDHELNENQTKMQMSLQMSQLNCCNKTRVARGHRQQGIRAEAKVKVPVEVEDLPVLSVLSVLHLINQDMSLKIVQKKIFQNSLQNSPLIFL